ncbi:YadA-like family protein, partial [Luteibacter sp. SG786]|uniref:YadA-like family protein n=1 Tax=Luteibacter sp. SG786 TaxID=2587130 RepID=UPI001ABBB4AF
GAWATADYATSLGWNSWADGVSSTAIGESAIAAAANSVALGAGSYNERANTVSVGDVGAERQITNVAAGTERTDAVNKAQLDTLADSVSSAAHYVSATGAGDGSDDASATGELATATGAGSSASGDLSTASGAFATASNESTTAVGAFATASGAGSTAIGDSARALAANSVALGSGSLATRANTVSVGSAGNNRQITNVAAGTQTTDAVNLGQLNSALSSAFSGTSGTAGNAVAMALGGGATMGANGFVGPVYRVQGSSYGSVGDAVGALDGALSSLDNRVGALETQSDGGSMKASSTVQRTAAPSIAARSAPTPAVTPEVTAAVTAAAAPVATGTPTAAAVVPITPAAVDGGGAPITNVAAGTAPTDAANVSQVDQAVATAKSYADQGDATTLQSAKAYTDQRFGDVVSGGAFDEYKRTVDHRFSNLNDRLNKVGAMGAAMSQMAFSTQGVSGDNRLGVGVGGYKGQGALSVGYSRSITPRATVTFGAAISGGESSGGVGVGVGW